MIIVATGMPEQSEHLTIKATVSDVEPLFLRYSKSTQIVPDKIVVEYRRNNFRPWEISRIKVYGGKLLKSGKASDNPLSRHDVDLTFFGDMREDVPAWAREFAETNKPLDGCAIAVVQADDELGLCPEPPVAVVNIHRRPENYPTKSEVFGSLVTVGRTVREPRCCQHLAMDGDAAVPFSTL